MTAVAERAADRWEGEEVGSLAALWRVPEVHAFERLGSTSDVARRLAEAGAPAGATVVAGEQLAGRGRVGRAWSSPAGMGLWASMVARPRELPAPAALPLLVGLEVARALDGFVGAGATGIKWPNDLLVAGRKLGGILCEAAWTGSALSFVIIGVGLNVLQGEDDFPGEIRGRATSLRAAGASGATLREVAAAVIPALHLRLSGALALGPGELAEPRGRDALLGRRVAVTDAREGARLPAGAGAGIAADGALLLRDEAGTLHSIHSGTARIDDSNSEP